MWFATFNPLLLAQETESVPFYKETAVLFTAAIVLILVSCVAGFAYARSIRMPDYGWKLSLMLSSVLVAAVIIFGGWPPRLGVDLRGGVTYVGQVMVLEEGDSIEMPQLISKIKQRIDPSGTKEIVVRALGQDKIEIIIPRVESIAEADRIWNRAVQAGYLKFKIVATNSDPITAKAEAEARQRKKTVEQGSSSGGRTTSANWVTLGRDINPETNRLGLFKLVPSSQNLIRDKKTGQVLDPPGSALVDADAFTAWATQPGANGVPMHPEIEILVINDNQQIEGEDLFNVRMGIDRFANSCVNFRVKPGSVAEMATLTGRNEGRQLGIVLDDTLLSAPVIQTQIRNDGQITGRFTNKEVEDLIGILKAGTLKTPVNKYPISRDQVTSSIGRDLQRKGVWAIGISFAVVVVFMLFYYRFAGVVACLALFTNLALIVAVVLLIKQPITLTGLAGLVLTVGMSVDANVLIFERIREELDRGSNLRLAIRNGFGRATVTIVDANITTLITALVLYAIGTEQIRGFCVALILGIVMSMFTAIFCSRVTFDIAEKRRWIKELKMTRWVGTTSFDFIGKRTVALGVSCGLIVVGLIAAVGLGESIFGHDLRGGTTARVLFQDEIDVDDVRKALEDAKVTNYQGKPVQFEVTMVTSTEAEGDADAIKPKTHYKIDSSLQPYEGDPNDRPDDYPTLQGILKNVFGDKLAKYSVDFSGPQVESTGSTSLNLPAPIRNVLKEESWVGAPATNVQYIGAQDGNAQDAAGSNNNQDDTKSDDTKSDETKASGGDVGAGDTSATAQQDDQAQSGDVDNAKAGDQQAETAGQDQGKDSGQDTGGNAKPDTGDVQSFTSVLTFSYPITADGLKAEMAELGQNTFGIGEDDISLVPTEDAADSPSAKKWTATITSNDREAVAGLLEATKKSYEGTTYFSSISEVGGQIAAKAQLQALMAVLLSLVGIVAYLWVRFQRVVFGLAAVVALVHDVLFVLGAIAITGVIANFFGFASFGAVKITLPVVAAFLTIIGYSLNDTIVVFDRIREVRGKNPNLTGEMINRSIGQTLSRTVLTSFTTFIVVFILLIGGGDAIQGFAFALVVGVVVGTYSSIFVASPVLLWLVQNKKLNMRAAGAAPK